MINKDKANFLLENLDTHVLVVGNTGTGKTELLKNAKIENARYYHFPDLTELVHLCNDNFEQFDFLDTPEKTLILDGVYISEHDVNSKLVNFIRTARQHGKRLIVVTLPDVGELIKSHFGAVIMLSGNSNSARVSQAICMHS
ncbi:ATP-binding protein [Hafnia paralvei]|uniref:ATP-binding protein n=1 Tax=Hafnia paralvei TaxID=546367 RepID=UPI002FDC21E9